MKLYIVFFSLISLMLTSCTSALPETDLGSNFNSSLPVKSLTIHHREKIIVPSSFLNKNFNETFRQALRIGDGTFNIIDFYENYPFQNNKSEFKLVKFNPKDSSSQNYFFDISAIIDLNDEFKKEQYQVPQYHYPLAFFDVETETYDNMISRKTYFLHFFLTDSNQTELWLTESSIGFAHKIDTINHFKPQPNPMAFYHNFIDYYHGWIAYTKGNDIHLINLFAELSIMEDKTKKDQIRFLLQSSNNSFTYDLNLYHQNKPNRVIPDALKVIFKPETATDMKRLLHLHELKNHILLTFPTQNSTDMMYVFDKQFNNPPVVFEIDKDHYRIYRGKDTENDHSMIIMFDSYADEIEFFDLVSKENFAIDLTDILSPEDRAINHLIFSKHNHQFELFIFPDAFTNIQNHHFLILELDDKIRPISTIQVKLETDQAQYHYQTIHRTHENDFFLLASNKDHNEHYLFQFSLEDKTADIEAICYSFGYFKGDLKMLYHPKGYFMLQSTQEREYYGHNIFVNFFQLHNLEAQVKEKINEVNNG